MKKVFTEKLRDVFCLCFALFGLAVVGIGIQKIYEPLAYIYGGVVMIFIADLGMKRKK